MKIVGLIPSRLNSTRLKQKALLKVEGIPIVIHTYMRSIQSKLLDDVYICTDSKLISDTAEKYKAKVIMTSKKHKNGTERIAEAAKKIQADLIVDIQGDEPLINPKDIDRVIKFHLKNLNFGCVVPHMKFYEKNKKNVVKIVHEKNRVIFFSRSDLPVPFRKKVEYLSKHLSIISFKKKDLITYSQLKMSNLEKYESIELLRCLDSNICIGTFLINGSSMSIDIKSDFNKALKLMKHDKIFKTYKKKLLIFDFDGVLADSIDNMEISWSHVKDKFNLKSNFDEYKNILDFLLKKSLKL